MSQLVPLVVAAVATGVAGGVLPLLLPPSERVRAYVQHVAGGILLAVIAIELTPELRALGEPEAMVAGFIGGALLMIGLKGLSRRAERRNDARPPWGMAVAAGMDTLLDGIVVGAGFALDPRLGALLAVGLALDLSALTASTAIEFREAKAKRWVTLATITSIAMSLAIGAMIGFAMLREAGDQLLAAVLGLATTALIYLVTEELLSRGREARNSAGTVFAFFAGFIALAAFTALTGS